MRLSTKNLIVSIEDTLIRIQFTSENTPIINSKLLKLFNELEEIRKECE